MFLLILFLVPTLAVLSSLYLYQHTGKKEFLKLDLVQFVYAFILSPIIYVWLKSFLFVFLVGELNLHLSDADVFIADTAYTIIFLYFFAFLVIHSLTKSFELKRSRDPFYDIFQHSEFFHLLTSHAVIYIGAMILLSALSILNVFIPLSVSASMPIFYAVLMVGFIFGLVADISLLLNDGPFEERYPKFEMFIELLYAFVFILNVGFYFYFRPPFNMSHVMYWFVLIGLSGFVLSSIFLERSEKVVGFIKKFHYKGKGVYTPINPPKFFQKKGKNKE
jgi:uncharacterized membrane protein YiaA